MDDEEREELFEALVETFEEAGLAWVTAEITDLVAQGVEEQITAAEWTGRGKPRQGETRTTRRAYTPFERVDLLLSAVSRVLLDGLELEASIVEFFKTERDLDQVEEGEGQALPLTESDPSATLIDPPVAVRFRSEPARGADDSEGFELDSPTALAGRADAVQSFLVTIERVRAEASQ